MSTVNRRLKKKKCFDVPQVSTKTTVVNFSVKQLGLEAQLLGIVVQREQPSLEEQSSELTVKVSQHDHLICVFVKASL